MKYRSRRLAILAGCLVAMLSGSAALAADFAGLQAWVGKYPFDRVGGKVLLDYPGLRPAIERLLGAEYRGWSSIRGPSPPVMRVGERIVANYCQAHDCGDKNTTILVHPGKNEVVVCWINAPAQPAARWFVAGKAPTIERGQTCPGTEDEVRAAVQRLGL